MGHVQWISVTNYQRIRWFTRYLNMSPVDPGNDTQAGVPRIQNISWRVYICAYLATVTYIIYQMHIQVHTSTYMYIFYIYICTETHTHSSERPGNRPNFFMVFHDQNILLGGQNAWSACTELTQGERRQGTLLHPPHPNPKNNTSKKKQTQKRWAGFPAVSIFM